MDKYNTSRYKDIDCFFDADFVLVAPINRLKKLFAGVECLPDFDKKSWDINDLDVMAMEDFFPYLHLLLEHSHEYNFIAYDENHWINTVNGCIYEKGTGKFIKTD